MTKVNKIPILNEADIEIFSVKNSFLNPFANSNDLNA
jgi:hypothetical protein